MRGEQLERQITEQLARIQISHKFKDWAIKYLHELHGLERASQKAVIEAQQKAYQACLQALDSLVALKTSPENADGSQLSNEEYGRRRVTLLKEKAVLEELLQDAGQHFEQRLRLAEETFEFACTAQERFAKGSPDLKKRMIVTFASNLTLKDKRLCIEARKPFFTIGESISGDNPGNMPIEPENTGLPQGSIDAPKSHRPSVLARLDEARTLQHKDKLLVKAIYHFFKSVCESPNFTLSDWFLLYHSGSMDDWTN